MSPTKVTVLVKDEKPMIIVRKIQGHWSFSFGDDPLCLITEPREIIDFLTGKKPLRHKDKLYFWDIFPQEMKISPSELSIFVQLIMKEEIDKCKNDSDYFYNTYYK